MQRITKHYVIETHRSIPMYGGSQISYEVSNRNAELVEYNPNILCFQFYDVVEVTLDDGEKLVGKPKNYSELIYFGKRMCIYGDKEIIKCDNGTVLDAVINKGLTVDEYKQKEMPEAGKGIKLQK